VSGALTCGYLTALVILATAPRLKQLSVASLCLHRQPCMAVAEYLEQPAFIPSLENGQTSTSWRLQTSNDCGHGDMLSAEKQKCLGAELSAN